VYAGSKAPPFDETVAPRPLAAYGGAKLAQEDLVRTWGAERDVRVLVGRIANLYGPGQDLAKPQGLISQLALATLQRRPLVLYVGVDTMRDYLYVTDAAAIVADSLELLRARVAPGGTVVKIVASQSSVTVGAVVAEMRRVAHVAPLVVRADTPLTAVQVRDLRLRSVVWPSLDRRPLTSLPTGLHAVVMHLRGRLAAGAVSGQPV
jgi:UDP-glucose 4-epimerase